MAGNNPFHFWTIERRTSVPGPLGHLCNDENQNHQFQSFSVNRFKNAFKSFFGFQTLDSQSFREIWSHDEKKSGIWYTMKIHSMPYKVAKLNFLLLTSFFKTKRGILVQSFPKFKLGVCESKSFRFTRFESPVLEIHKLFSLPLMCPNDPKNAGSDPSYPKYCSDSKSDCAIVFRSLFPANLTWFGKYCSLGSGFTRYPKSRYAPKLTIFELGDFFPNAPADSSPVFSQV